MKYRTPLGEVCQVIGGGTPSKRNPSYYGGEIPWATVRDMNQDILSETEYRITAKAVSESSTNIIPAQNVVIATRVGLGKVCFITQDTAINQDLRAVVPLSETQLSKRYLYWWFKSVAHKILAAGKGATVQGVTLPFLRSLEIPIPTLPEQKRIVAILEEGFEGIATATANAKKNLANAREFFETYLNTSLRGLATGAVTQTLACITELIVDCEHKTAPTQETGYPSIRTPNIGKGQLMLENVYRVSEETYKLWTRRGKPQPGDLILAREAPAGNVAVIPEGQQVCLGQRTVLIRPVKELVDPYFLTYLLLHPIMQERLLSHSTGATVQHVNLRDIRQLGVSALPGIPEQSSIAKELIAAQSQAKCLQMNYQKKLANLSELSQSILQKAFSGELTRNAA